jgi:aromatic ring-opening dioxygenase catalytic subunit (LigB family)
VYLSHGAGPLPILGDPGHEAMVTFMRQLPDQLARPEAILVISAHWEEPAATIFSAENTPLFYDYYGFPAEAYDIRYPAPDSPDLVKIIQALLGQAHIPYAVEPSRGLDHGVFIPLKLMFPGADIPVVQLSLLSDLNPAAHLALGKALHSVLEGNVLVIGSGFSFHNLNAFFTRDADASDPANEAFQDWLIETVTSEMSRDEREKRLIDWKSAPSARYCHPREAHLLPLHVCAGIAGDQGQVIFDDRIMGKRGLAFRW